MSADKLITALMGGIFDGFTLPHIAVIALLMAYVILLRNELCVLINGFSGFILAYFVAVVLLRAGTFNGLLLSAAYYKLTAVFYSLIGLVLIIIGSVFFREWRRSLCPGVGIVPFPAVSCPMEKFSRIVFRIGLLIGGLLAGGSFSAPINASVISLANEIFLPGLFWASVWLLFFYECVFVFFLTVIFLLIYYYLKRNMLRLTASCCSWGLMVLASAYMASGIGFLVVFTQQLI